MRYGFCMPDPRCKNYPWIRDINVLLQELSPDRISVAQEGLRRAVENGNLFVVIDTVDNEERIIGMGYLSLLYPPSGIAAKIDDVVVLPSHRGQKLGELIMKALMDKAYDQNAQYIELRNNLANPNRAAARHIYEKLGFQSDGNYMCYYFPFPAPMTREPRPKPKQDTEKAVEDTE